jgi:hypothetical protein
VKQFSKYSTNIQEYSEYKSTMDEARALIFVEKAYTQDAERWVEERKYKERTAAENVRLAKNDLLQHAQVDYDVEANNLKKALKEAKAVGAVWFDDDTVTLADSVKRVGKALEAAHRKKQDVSDSNSVEALRSKLSSLLSDAWDLGMSGALMEETRQYVNGGGGTDKRREEADEHP